MTNMDQHLLSIILLMPIAGLLILLLIPGKQRGLIRVLANLVAFVGFVVSLRMLSLFDDPAAYRHYLREKYHEEREFDQPTIAHELRSPAGRISSFAALLLECPDVYDNALLSDLQRDCLTTMAELVRQLLTHAIFRRD